MTIEINGLPKLPLATLATAPSATAPGVALTPASLQSTEPNQSSSPPAGTTGAFAQNVATATPASPDSVSLTRGGQQLVELEAKLKDIPITDSERINTIRQAIADGDYKPDFARIANKLVQLETLLYRKS